MSILNVKQSSIATSLAGERIKEQLVISTDAGDCVEDIVLERSALWYRRMLVSEHVAGRSVNVALIFSSSRTCIVPGYLTGVSSVISQTSAAAV